MDLPASLNRINHDIAVATLGRLGFGRSLHLRLRSYLWGRALRVKIDDEVFASFPTLSGIFQSSLLGELISFPLLYFNDVNLLLKSHQLVFADNLKIYIRVDSQRDATQLHDDLETVHRWCKVNCMLLNLNRVLLYPIVFDYSLVGTPLQRQPSTLV